MGNVMYRDPVLRYVLVCAPLTELMLDDTTAIRNAIAAEESQLCEQVKKSPGDFDLADAGDTIGKLRKEVLEGAAVRFRDIEVWLDGIEGSARESRKESRRVRMSASITTCMLPRHCKISVRTVLAKADEAEEPGAGLEQCSIEVLGEVLDSMERTCEKYAGLILRTYQDIVKDKVKKDIDRAHTLRIRTASVDLGETAEKLKAREFRISAALEERPRYGWIEGMMYLAGQDGASDKGGHGERAAEYRWIAMNVSDEDMELIGLYAAHQWDSRTDFVGLVHGVNGFGGKGSISKVFSKRFVQNIVSRI